MKHIGQLLTGIGLIMLAGTVLIVVLRVDDYLTQQAIHDCAQDYRMEYVDPLTNTTVIKPIDDLYEQCLETKGL